LIIVSNISFAKNEGKKMKMQRYYNKKSKRLEY
jgi:hypothetical protein